MRRMPAWSFSSLSAFETCPRRYYVTKVTREVVEPPTEATTHGNEVHAAFEQAVLKQEPLPQKYEQWQPIVTKINTAAARREAELKLAINKSFQPVGWFDKSAWCRGVVDLNIENGDKAVALDYKTGKRKPESTQLQLFAALLFHTKQYLANITTAFVWLKDGKLDRESYSRDEIGSIWQEFMPRVQRMESAYEKDKWVPQPSGLCRSHCPVLKCEFNGRR